MKKSAYLLLLFLPLLSGCSPPLDAPTAFNVAGLYQLIWYSSKTISDDNPAGTLQATEVNEDHINLIVKGQSGKVKISYSYTNVLVAITNSNSGQVDYNLSYNKRLIGSAHVDGVSRSIVFTPSSTLRIEGLEL